MIESILSGLAFGLAAGLSPGPFMALVIAQSVRYGAREGLKVAFAPLGSDLPVVLLSLLVLSRLTHLAGALAWLSLAGGGFVAWLGWESLRRPASLPDGGGEAPRSLGKAIVLNSLNPHVYLFWATVGAPMILRSRPAAAATFVAAFYTSLLASKVALALAASRARGFLSSRAHRLIMRLLGVALLALAGWLIASGVRTLRG